MLQTKAQNCRMTLSLDKRLGKSNMIHSSQSDKNHNPMTKTSQIVSDGIIVTSRQDPPGQYSAYIRPGDPCREIYRLLTFEKFPEHSPVNPCQLAAAGIFYTGYKDRVKCFSCAQTVENWSPGYDPLSLHWHSTDCQFILGTDKNNVPLGTTLQNQRTHSTSTRLATTARSSAISGEPRTSSPEALTSRMSRSGHDVPVTTPLTSTNTASTSSNVATSYNTNAGQASHFFEQLIYMLPCSNPVNPHLRNVTARLQTFRERSHTWPAHRIAATPEEMSQAGLYYLGERDRVKCWYCNGGLQNWEKFDNPWFEYAKWFPTCEYLLQKKGPEFIENISNRFINLDRPVINNPAGPLATNINQQASRHRPSLQAHKFPTILDPREHQIQLETRVNEEMQTSSFAPEAKIMGFSDEEIRETFLKHIENHNTTFVSFTNSVECILALQKDKDSSLTTSTESQNRDHPPTSNKNNGSSISSPNPRQELEELRHTSLYKKCFQSKASVVFLPCGHLATCRNCSKQNVTCPICKEKSLTKDTSLHCVINKYLSKFSFEYAYLFTAQALANASTHELTNTALYTVLSIFKTALSTMTL